MTTTKHKAEAKTESDIRLERDKWLRENWGVLARIANELGVSHSKVRLTFAGAIRTSDPNVTGALAAAGAPGFEK